MELAVNRAERIRVRALQEARKGNYAAYWKLVNLSFELGSLKEVGSARRW